MAFTLYFNPISSYSQKVLIAFYEKGIPFEPQVVDLMNEAAKAEYRKVWPIGKVPFLKDTEKNWDVPESTTIVEYLDRHGTGTPLIPKDEDLARQTRMRDRFFDNYVNEPMQKVIFDGFRPSGKNDPLGVDRAKDLLIRAYGMINQDMANKTWAMGKDFTLADCSAAPALYYARTVLPFGNEHPHVASYFERLLARPSFARVVKEVEPILAKVFAK